MGSEKIPTVADFQFWRQYTFFDRKGLRKRKKHNNLVFLIQIFQNAVDSVNV